MSILYNLDKPRNPSGTTIKYCSLSCTFSFFIFSFYLFFPLYLIIPPFRAIVILLSYSIFMLSLPLLRVHALPSDLINSIFFIHHSNVVEVLTLFFFFFSYRFCFRWFDCPGNFSRFLKIFQSFFCFPNELVPSNVYNPRAVSSSINVTWKMHFIVPNDFSLIFVLNEKRKAT